MACNNNVGCNNNCGHNGFLVVIVLYILLAIILGSVIC